jgi:hypothetical protein
MIDFQMFANNILLLSTIAGVTALICSLIAMSFTTDDTKKTIFIYCAISSGLIIFCSIVGAPLFLRFP